MTVLGLGAATILFEDANPTAKSEPEKVETSSNTSPPAATDLAAYAFLLPELEGLPPTTTPGTEIEIWATWEPPVTKKLKVHRLIPTATVTEIIPSIEPGPPTVMLELERRAIPDLMYGDKFASLSVVLPSEG